MFKKIVFYFIFILFSDLCFSQPTSSYLLHEGKIAVGVPSDWSMIMQKDNGNPQILAFQVKNPAESGTQESSRVTITAKSIRDTKDFQAFVDAANDKSKQTPGYEIDKENKNSGELRYSGLDGKTRYFYREALHFNNSIAIQVRCTRPQLKSTTETWIENFNKGCDQVISAIKTTKIGTAQ